MAAVGLYWLLDRTIEGWQVEEEVDTRQDDENLSDDELILVVQAVECNAV